MKLSELDTEEHILAFSKEVTKKICEASPETTDVYNEGTIKSMKDISNNLKKSLDVPMSEKEKETWLDVIVND